MMRERERNDRAVARDFITAMREACGTREGMLSYIRDRFVRRPALLNNPILIQNLWGMGIMPVEIDHIAAGIKADAEYGRMQPAAPVTYNIRYAGMRLHELSEQNLSGTVNTMLARYNNHVKLQLIPALDKLPHTVLKRGYTCLKDGLTRIGKLELLSALLTQAFGVKEDFTVNDIVADDARQLSRVGKMFAQGGLTVLEAENYFVALGNQFRGVPFKEWAEAAAKAPDTPYPEIMEKKRLREESWLKIDLSKPFIARFDILAPSDTDALRLMALQGKEVILRGVSRPREGHWGNIVTLEFVFRYQKEEARRGLGDVKLRPANIEWVRYISPAELAQAGKLLKPRRRLSLGE